MEKIIEISTEQKLDNTALVLRNIINVISIMEKETEKYYVSDNVKKVSKSCNDIINEFESLKVDLPF